MELGPLRVVSSDGEPARLEERDVTWSEYADVIFGEPDLLHWHIRGS